MARESTNKIPYIHSQATLQRILDSNLNKTYFKVGDKVRFKKPTRPKIVGTIVAIQEEVNEVTWSNNGTTPMNIVIEVIKRDSANGLVYGYERVKTNVKKIILYEGNV